ncbi:MAG: hypothetical protein GY772_21330 [bacterium]|nr:hypothetical protein [bacterium]
MPPRLARTRTPAAVVRAAGDAGEPPRRRTLLEELAKLFALGTLSAPAVVELAVAAAGDAGRSGGCSVRELARVAERVRDRRNYARAVRAVFAGAGRREQAPLCMAELPIVRRDASESTGYRIEQTAWPLALPLFELPGIVQDRERLPQFAVEAGSPMARAMERWVAELAETGLEAPSGEVVPIGLYADAAPFAEHNSVYAITWNVLRADHPERHVLTCLASSHLCNCGCKGTHTLQSLFRVLVGSLSAMAAGSWPRARDDGSAWSDEQRAWMERHPYLPRAALLQKRGDWSWFKTCFSFRAWSSRNICWKCDAGVHHSWADTSTTASWREHRVSTRELLARTRAQQTGLVSALFDIPGFRAESIAIDLLHTADLGVTSEAAGSLLWEELLEPTRGGTKELRLASLNGELQEFYRSHDVKSRLLELTAQSVQSPGKPPSLRAKAAETRYLVPWFRELASSNTHRSHFRREHYECRARCFNELACFYASLEAEPFSAEATRAHGVGFLDAYGGLHDELRLRAAGAPRAVVRDDLPWRFKPKHHLFQHLVEEQVFELGNPLEYWTYTDESIMGVLSVMAASTPDPRGVCEQVLWKLRLLASMDL